MAPDQRDKRGTSPGTLIFTGKQKIDRAKIIVFDYDVNSFSEKEVQSPEELTFFKDSNKVSWLNVTGLHDLKIMERIGDVFNLHPLVMEDILNVEHSPKVENYDEYLFLIAKMIDLNSVQALNIEQVSFVLGKNYLITFQEDDEDVFNFIRERIRQNIGRVRKFGADYLMYRLLDSIVDNYFTILDNFDDRIERLEDKLIETPEKTSISSIHILRKEVSKLRRAVFPLRDTIYALEKERDVFIKKNTYFFLRDLSDHLKHFIDSVEGYRETMNGIMDVYLSNASHKMNEVIKLLTIISSIFIPLTFIVGIYGMNFKTEISWWNMPELSWQYGYPAIMIFMLLLAGGLIYIFKRKKWF
ncbi:MAG: magnesium/cobalt transporter CorA [Ignavibacteriaceae bacterium]